jgi:DNA transposition AAA+ family ATPase
MREVLRMSEMYSPEMQERLRRYVSEAGGQNKAAGAIGLSSSIISQYLRSIYHEGKGDVGKTEQTLREFFRVQDECKQQPGRKTAAGAGTFRYVPTTVSEHVYKSIRYCQLEKNIAMIYGDAGIGKTMGALKFSRDFPTTAVYLYIDPIKGVMSRFVRTLADKLRIQACRDVGVLADEIAAKLVGTNKVLILDEGQNLHFRTMELIRAWVDDDPESGKPGVSVVLIGNRRMYTRMQGRQQEDYAQQFSRSRPQPVSTRMCTRKDVAQIFPALAEQGKEKEIDFLHSVSRSKWGIRNATYIYSDAVRASDVSYDCMRDIARNRGIGVN